MVQEENNRLTNVISRFWTDLHILGVFCNIFCIYYFYSIFSVFVLVLIFQYKYLVCSNLVFFIL